MALSRDLLDQAKFLTSKEKNKPKQASLRRAVSTAYYAVFHLLAAEAASQASSSTPLELSKRVQRALEHTEMKQGAKGFEGSLGSLPKHIQPLLTAGLSTQLNAVARNFSQLQEERHAADYDLTAKFDRARVQSVLANAEQVFVDWKLIRNTDEARVFLAALMFSKRWNR